MTYRAITKRPFDVLLSSLGILLFLPLLAVIALVVWCDVRRPVLYRQLREGRRGKPFTLLKFRSMRETRDARGRLLPDSARLTRVGRWLRRTSLDELPSLFNVFRGDLSVVGPRPLPVGYAACYSPRQARRLEVLPGMTGWAAVNGRNAQSWERIFEHDVWYVDHVCFSLDVRIIVRTLLVVLRREGIERGDSDAGSAFAAALGNRPGVQPAGDGGR